MAQMTIQDSIVDISHSQEAQVTTEIPEHQKMKLDHFIAKLETYRI